MSGGLKWYKRDGAEFVQSCLELALEEKGAFCVVLDLIYANGGPIRDDARWLAGNCSVSVRKWVALRARLIEVGKLTSEGGFLSNRRAEKQIETTAKTHRKLVESGAKGGRTRAENEAIRNENNVLVLATLKHRAREDKDIEEKEEKNTKKETSRKAANGPQVIEDFARFKAAYPRRDGSQDWLKASEVFGKLVASGTPAEEIIAGAQRYRADCRRRGEEGGRFVKQARTWLNGRGWEEFDGAPSPEAPAIDWRGLVGRYAGGGSWPSGAGPAPDYGGCRAPPDLLAEFGFAQPAGAAAGGAP
jgi:uncharacterized protein YdaU (DUF1376 family)